MADRSAGACTEVTADLLRGWPLPDPGGDKEAKGRLLVVGGSVRNPGAVVLAAEAALRAGAGKVQVVTAAETAVHVATVVPECLVVGVETAAGELSPAGAGRVLELADAADAVLAGPGVGAPSAAVALLEAVVPHLRTALVLDALGTAYVTAHPDGLAHLEGRVLVTPNVVELAQVLGEDEPAVARDPVRAARRAAERTAATVLAGTDESYVVEPDGVARRVTAGTPGLAVAGSGDVKAGIVAALMARGAEPARAAAWGAWAHGRAGEYLASTMGPVGFLAREVSARVPAELALARPGG
ncbi:NAD(P)H-hydrate dehydratase [Fodinibacter luteus]|uniref:ADP-dependent (S)-NAD(P)H-hydrate dehydratase n=1 Tax=Fodinibacter luteus TaxID=552064 RepID=A0ABP8JY45_9MICO